MPIRTAPIHRSMSSLAVREGTLLSVASRAPVAPRLGRRSAVACRAMAEVDLVEAARLAAFTGMSCGGFVAGVELARQANKAIAFGRTMTPSNRGERKNEMVFLATLLALDVFLVSTMGLASAGVAHGLLSQVPPA